jgi:hypothetical protein
MTSTLVDLLQGVAEGLAIKAPVVCATTGSNIVLSGVQPVDGITVGNNNERVLVKDNTDTTTNGLYNAGPGDWTRCVDFDGARDAVTGTLIVVNPGGAVNGGTQWLLSTTDNPIVFGTSHITFALPPWQATATAAAAAAAASQAAAAASAATAGTNASGAANSATSAAASATAAAAAAAAFLAGLNYNAFGVSAATTVALPANTYANGAAGVGATLTGNSNGALPSIDTVAPTTSLRIAVMNEAAGAHNGLYQVTQVGDGSHPYILTRVTDANTAATLAYIVFVVFGGTANVGRQYLLNLAAGAITVGTTALTFGIFNGGSGFGSGLVTYASDNATDAAIAVDSAKMLAEEIRGDAYENNLALGPRTLAAWSAQFAAQAIGPLVRVGAVKTNAILSQLAAIATHAVPKAGAAVTISSTGTATQICIGLVGETLFALWIDNASGHYKVYYSTWALHGGTPSAPTLLLDMSALSLDVTMGAVKVDTDGKTIHIFARVSGGGNDLIYHYSSSNLLVSLSQPHLVGGGSGGANLVQAGGVEQLDDGTLLVACYTYTGTFNSYLYASVDGGVSWLLRSTILTGSAYTDGNARNETSLKLNRATKELVAATRSNADGGTATPVYMSRSQDFGVTWDGGTAGPNGKGQPWIEDIGGGAVAYFDRGATQTQIVCRISLDFGRSFGSQIVLDQAGGGNAGYLTATPIGNRTLQVAYQLNGSVVTRTLTFDPAIQEPIAASLVLTGGTLGTVSGAKYRRSGDDVSGGISFVATMAGAGTLTGTLAAPETSSDLGAAAPNINGTIRDSTGVYSGTVWSTGTTIKFSIALPNGASTVSLRFGYEL